jgi:4'-phosphopantetheinyl transferase
MTTASGRPETAGAPRTTDPADQADQTAEVFWFDTRVISLTGSDLAEMDAREKARAAAFVFPVDRHRYQVAHVMLRRVLAEHLGTDPSRLTFGRQPCPTCGGPSGKPVLTGPDGESGEPGRDGWAGLSFSLAHSSEAVAIAVARGPVGIDVELAPTGCVCSLASAMHPDDAAIVEALPEPERHDAVIRWWVRAEAVLKCAGTGIAHGMDAFPVLGAPVRSRVPSGPWPPLEPDVPGWAAAAGCSFAALSAPKGYQAALALPELRLIRYSWGPGR